MCTFHDLVNVENIASVRYQRVNILGEGMVLGGIVRRKLLPFLLD
jgi:hypothetical protein